MIWIATCGVYLVVAACLSITDWFESLTFKYGKPSILTTLAVGFGWPAYALFWLGEIVYFKVKDTRS